MANSIQTVVTSPLTLMSELCYFLVTLQGHFMANLILAVVLITHNLVSTLFPLYLVSTLGCLHMTLLAHLIRTVVTSSPTLVSAALM